MAGALEKARVHVGNEPMGARDSGFWSAGVDDFTVAEQDGCGCADSAQLIVGELGRGQELPPEWPGGDHARGREHSDQPLSGDSGERPPDKSPPELGREHYAVAA